MRLSASRIRSLSIRYVHAEESAFPGIRAERSHFPYNLRPARSVPSSPITGLQARIEK